MDIYYCSNCGKRLFEADKIFWCVNVKSNIPSPTCSKECAEKYKELTLNK